MVREVASGSGRTIVTPALHPRYIRVLKSVIEGRRQKRRAGPSYSTHKQQGSSEHDQLCRIGRRLDIEHVAGVPFHAREGETIPVLACEDRAVFNPKAPDSEHLSSRPRTLGEPYRRVW